MHARIKSLAHACGDSVDNPQGEVLAAWTAILKINYWPIFAIAKDILQHLDSADAARILRRLAKHRPVSQRNRRRKRPRPDRPHIPEAYRRPQIPCHLLHPPCFRRATGPACRRRAWKVWTGRSADAIGKLRIGDFACGTGALALCRLRARSPPATSAPAEDAQQAAQCNDGRGALRLRRHAVCNSHHRFHSIGGQNQRSALANSRLYTMPYGHQKDGGVMIGSLGVATVFKRADAF